MKGGIRYKFLLPGFRLKIHEKELAKMEVTRLFAPNDAINLKELRGSFFLDTTSPAIENQLKHLTFFRKVELITPSLERSIIPHQVYLEGTTDLPRNSQSEKDLESKVQNLYRNAAGLQGKRVTQYLVHTFHQYKGRFYPQLVKALLNYSKIGKAAVVLDPFCGSGTMLVECFLQGIDSIGVDLNPLACFISRVKISTMKLEEINDLKAEINDLLEDVAGDFLFYGLPLYGQSSIRLFMSHRKPMNMKLEKLRFPDMPNISLWFNQDVLQKLLIIKRNILKIKDENIKNLCLLAFSNILREVSNQDPEQLRRMLRKKRLKRVPVYQTFKETLTRFYFTAYLCTLLKKKGVIEDSNADVRIYNADARNLDFLGDKSIDLVLTSPPYATALPYLDTDRFSLYFLDFVDREEYRRTEKEMVGNREITPKERKTLEAEFWRNYSSSSLPQEVLNLIKKLLNLATKRRVGFRRKNKPVLLYKYFTDMQRCIEEMERVLKPGKLLMLIVGENKTTLGEETIKIDTDDIIAKMANGLGFKRLRKIPMTGYTPYMVHQKQAITTESIQIFKKSV